MKIFTLFSSIILFSSTTVLFPQSEIYLNPSEANNSVAKVGAINITPQEFQQRYELTPIMRKHIKQMENSLKLEFLYTLIAEKLYALEAESRKLDTAAVIKFATEQYEKMFVRDELYKREIKDKINITEADLAVGFARLNSVLKINFLYTTDEQEIYNLFNMLNEGIPFDSILVERPEVNEQDKPIDVIYGQMQDDIEDTLYSKRIGEYTSPIYTPEGWYIFKVSGVEKRIFEEDKTNADLAAEVKKIIEARKTNKIYDQFFEEFFSSKKVEVDRELFKSLTEKLSIILTKKKLNFEIKDGELVYLLSDDVLNLEKMFGADSLKLNYIKFEKKPLSLKQFIRIMAFDGFSTKQTDINSIRASVNAKNRIIIERELLAREGDKRGYNLLSEVQNEVSMWRDNYLYQLLRNQFVDSVTVTEEETYAEYLKTNQPENYPAMLKVVEVLNDTLEVIEKVMKEFEDGKDLQELASLYTQREEAKKTAGVLGFFPETDYGELGRIASTLKIGEVYGPVKLNEGYSIFKLIDKQEGGTIKPQPFEKVEMEISRRIAEKKVRAKLRDFTVSLANKYDVKINPEILKSIEVTSLNSMTFRYLGFGGRITAVPLVAPDVEWVDPWIEQKNISQ